MSKAYIFKCPQCGAHKVYSPKKQALECKHCSSLTQIAADREVFKKPYMAGLALEVDPGTEIQGCLSCGARLNMLAGEISGVCPFCGVGNIVSVEGSEGLKPDECVPFAIENEDAERNFKKWLLKKWFVPNELKKKARIEKIRGVYSPVFAFDAFSSSTYTGVLGKHYTTYVGSGKNRRAVVRTRYFPISGSLSLQHNDIMTECSPHFDQKVLNRLRPFDLRSRAKYDKGFLSGFWADSADKDLDQGWQDCKAIADDETKRQILSRYSYDVVKSLNINTTYEDIKYSYMLLPLYVSSYSFKDKVFSFFVNGCTGKIFGKVPRSPVKILLAVLGALALMLAAFLLGQHFDLIGTNPYTYPFG